ncbi:UNVERIFIED_CONTAM: hypothetical protein FKN15_023083 [Acipenser sinensis]
MWIPNHRQVHSSRISQETGGAGLPAAALPALHFSTLNLRAPTHDIFKMTWTQIEKTVEITVRWFESRFDNIVKLSVEEGVSGGPRVIQCFLIFCHDAWPDDLVNFGDEQLEVLLNWYSDLLEKNGYNVDAGQARWRMLKTLVRGQFMDKSYIGLWAVMLTKEPFCTDLKNLLHLVEIMLVLPISAVQCERGFSAQNRIKSKLCNSVEDLVRISAEGPSLELFDPEPCPRVKGDKDQTTLPGQVMQTF